MKTLRLAGVALGLFAGIHAASAGVIFMDDFNGENGGVGLLNYNGFAEWAVDNGTVDLIGNSFWDLEPGNGLYVDMDGSTNNAGRMTTKSNINFAPGTTYTLSFSLAGNRRNTSNDTVELRVGIGGGILSKDISLAGTVPFTVHSYDFTVLAATAAKMSFEGLGSDNVGLLLDNVRISSVPEASTTGMLAALSLLGLFIMGRRRAIRR